MTIRVTGATGFIGAHCVLRLPHHGLGCFIDWFLDYYSLPNAHAPLAAELQRRSL